MKKYAVMVLALAVITVIATGSSAVEYGEAGYENEGMSESRAWGISSALTLAKVRDDINSRKVSYAAYYKADQ
ncbi:MAG: hypothetical protein IJQ58_02090 [Synergistaceae bacterium]|nr:hypothetical protein [Synergistaceae bacterium]MBR0256503.1 hypothetical protein [Synergistaceae bacterium]